MTAPAPIRHTNIIGEYFRSLVVVAVCTLIALPLRTHLAAANLVMIYLVGVVVVAAKFDRRAAALTSVLSVAAFDFFFVSPYLTLRVSDYEYVVTLLVMLGLALFISTMTARIRLHASEALARDAQTTALYRLSNEVAGRTRIFDILKVAAELAAETFHLKISIFMPDHAGQISLNKRTSDRLLIPSADQPIAQWVFEHGEKAGKGTQMFPKASAVYLPIKGESHVFGVMAVVQPTESKSMTTEEQHLLGIFITQTALAAERAIAASTAQAAEVRVETESLRTSLLSAVSHDLRTPLASITGAAATLKSHWPQLDTDTRNDLLTTVTDEAERLNRLLNNLLEVTRLESGVRLRKERVPLEEIVGAALHRLKPQLADRQVHTAIPADLPLVPMDAVLIEQVFINLLENAVKYTPPESAIEIAANHHNNCVEVEVRDRGAGFAPDHEHRVFDKFFRGRTDNVRGAGLGLAICRAVVEAHGGSIRAENRPGGGALIRFQIPLTSGTADEIALPAGDES